MPVVPKQVLSSASSTIYTPGDYETDKVLIQNIGPNAIYLQIGGAAATANNGYRLLTSATVTIGPDKVITAIAATADQVAGADTRLLLDTIL